MIDPVRQRIAVVPFLLICSLGALCSIVQVRDWGNELSNADPYSEANALREVRHFLEQGVTLHYGLEQAYYPGILRRMTQVSDAEGAKASVTPDGVYTHYPPGPEYLLYAAEKAFGPELVSRLRLLPIAIGWAATLFLGLAVRRRFGAGPGWLVAGACVFAPAVFDGFVGLHYQGYTLALLIVEIGIALGARALLAAFAVLGFLQGWLSFDYVFLVALVPLALELVLPRIDVGYEARWKMGWQRSVLAWAGFATAHALHFLQVWAYWGSLIATIRDFSGAAAHRAGAGEGVIGYLTQAAGNLKTYFYGLHPFHMGLSLPPSGDLQDWSQFRFLGLSLGPWWLLVTVGMIVWERLGRGHDTRSMRMDWHFVCAVGLVTSSLWFVVMVNHGGFHRHFIYRHLFFAFFVMALFAAVRFGRGAFAAGHDLDMASILTRSRDGTSQQETGHEIRHLL